MKSSRSDSISKILVYTLSLHSILFIGLLTYIRTEMTEKNQSAFEINGKKVFLIISIVALFAAEVISGILFWTNILSNYYAILKFIGIFSVNFASFSLMWVLNSSPNYGLISVLSYVFFGMTLAHLCSGNDDLDKTLSKSSPFSIVTYLGLVLVPLMLVLVLFVPNNLDWIVYSVLYPTAGMEAICFFIMFCKFTIFEDKQNSEALLDKDISDLKAQQDKNTDLEA